MRWRCHFSRALVVSGLAAVGNTLMAQEALRTALRNDAAARVRSQPVVLAPGEGLRIGHATFPVGLSYSVDLRDNVLYSHENRESDLIQRPALSIGVDYEMTSQSTLSMAMTFGYEDYLRHAELDHFFIEPDSEVALDVRVGDGLVTFYDRVDYSQDVATEGALSDVARFPRLENTVGVRSVWNIERWSVQAGYAHLNLWVTDEEFNYIERSDEQFFGRGGYNFEMPLQAGVEVSGSWSDYVLESENDRYTLSAGPYLDWSAAPGLQVALRGGGAYTVFMATNGVGTNGFGRSTDVMSYYAGLEIDHRLTDYITYLFKVGHDVRPGVNRGSDYIESTTLRLDFSWAMMRYLRLSIGAFGEVSEEVGLEGSSLSVSDSYNRIGTSVTATHQLTKRISWFARYAWTSKNADVETDSYVENRISVGGTYRF